MKVVKTGSLCERVGPVAKPTAKIPQVGGGTCDKGTATGKGGAEGKQTKASSNRTG